MAGTTMPEVTIVPANEITAQGALDVEHHVGLRSIFTDAGFTEVSRPTDRRAVVRIDF